EAPADDSDVGVPESESAPPALPRHLGDAAAVRHAVWSRDGSRCTYVDSRAERCRETAFVELHHVHPHARGGPPTEANLTLRCRTHNALAAEQDFGREFVQAKRHQGSTSVAVPP